MLVQPADMDPGDVAGCDCRYDVGMALTHTFTRFLTSVDTHALT